MGGWTITPDAREAVTSDVAGLVVWEDRLNGVRGEDGFVDGLVDCEDPAMAVFWNTEDAFALPVETFAGETDREEGRDRGLSIVLDPVVALEEREERENEKAGWLTCVGRFVVCAGVGVGIISDAEETRRDVSSTWSVLLSARLSLDPTVSTFVRGVP